MAWQWNVVPFMIGGPFADSIEKGHFWAAAGFAFLFVAWCAVCWLDQKEDR